MDEIVLTSSKEKEVKLQFKQNEVICISREFDDTSYTNILKKDIKVIQKDSVLVSKGHAITFVVIGIILIFATFFSIYMTQDNPQTMVTVIVGFLIAIIIDGIAGVVSNKNVYEEEIQFIDYLNEPIFSTSSLGLKNEIIEDIATEIRKFDN